MKGVNKVILVCTLGQDPKTHTFPDGNKVTKVSAATSESWNDKASGERKEITDWHNLKFTGKLADIAEQYLRKGSKIYVEGQNKTTKHQDSNGNEKYMHEVVIGMRGQLQMLDSKPEGTPAQQQRQGAANYQAGTNHGQANNQSQNFGHQQNQQQSGGYQNNSQRRLRSSK